MSKFLQDVNNNAAATKVIAISQVFYKMSRVKNADFNMKVLYSLAQFEVFSHRSRSNQFYHAVHLLMHSINFFRLKK